MQRLCLLRICRRSQNAIAGRRSYITAQETMDCFPGYQTMIADEPDVLGVEYIKLLKQEIRSQSRLELILANGEQQQVEEYCRIAEPLWKQVKKQIKGERACANIVQAFNEQRYDVTKPMLRGVLFKLLRNDKFVPGWGLANYMVKSKAFVRDEMDHLFQIAFAALAERDRSAENIFENLPKEFRNQKAFHAFMAGSALKRKNRVRMERLLKELKDKSWYTDAFALNQMMLFYEQPELRKRIPELFEEAKSLGIAPDVSSYNIFIGSHSREKNLQGMEEVFQLLNDDPLVNPDESTFFILACGYISAGCFDKAGQMLVAIEEKLEGGEFKRKQATYNKLLRLYGDTKDGEGVEGVWEILSSRRLKAIESYGFAIEAFGKAVGVHRAEEIFAKLDGLLETSQVISMMSVYTSHGRMDKAKELFQHLPRKRMRHRVVVYRHLIAGYLRDEQPKKALQMFNMGCTVLRHRCLCRSWERVLINVLDHFANKGDVQTIERIYETNQELKKLKDMRVYRLMLKAYLNQRAPVQRFLKWTETLGLSLDAQTRQLLMMLQKKNKYD